MNCLFSRQALWYFYNYSEKLTIISELIDALGWVLQNKQTNKMPH